MLLFEGKTKSSLKVETGRTAENSKMMPEVLLWRGHPVLSQACLGAMQHSQTVEPGA